MYEISFPRPDEMEQLKKLSTPYEFSDSDLMKKKFNPLDDEFNEIRTWARILAQRLHELNFSYVMASFYYHKGIPDEPYYNITSNKYFPNFTEKQHWLNKEGFEYYSEIFLYKSFSALDTVAHILTVNYELEWAQKQNISFIPSVKKLKSIDPDRFERLAGIINSADFKNAKELRNHSTHNISPGQIDNGLFTDLNGLTISTIGRYTPVSVRYKMMTSHKNHVFEVVDIVKQE